MKRIILVLLIIQIFLPHLNYSNAQTIPLPKISVAADSSCVTIETNNIGNWEIPMTMTMTNFNPSISLVDTSFAMAFDSLHSDKTTTIVTVYETDDDNIVGLWQISNAGAAKLWLNSQRASYEDFSIRYRKSNEKGVVVHTMTYVYPEMDSLYDGHDTLCIGICDTILGVKNLCTFQYFDTKISAKQQRILESALAIRYGAWLHGIYLNSEQDTLWDPLGKDSTFTYGICGIGRDDSLSLLQPKSIIRNDILSIAAPASLPNLVHVMMGCDSNDVSLSPIPIVVNGEPFSEMERHWKLRGHGNDTIQITFSVDSIYSRCRLIIESEMDTHIIGIDDTISILDGKDYYVSILIPAEGVASDQKQRANGETQTSSQNLPKGCTIAVAPNPTSGNYSVHISQEDEDYVNIQVVDVHGRTIETHKPANKVKDYCYSSSLSESGIYYVTISSNREKQTIKLIVAK